MVKSPVSDLEIPEVPVHQIVFQAMEMYADRVALVEGVTEREYTYREVLATIRRVASGLTKLGLRQRDIVAILSHNSPEYVIVLLAVLACGATVTTINPVYTVYEVSKHLEDSKPKMLFASPVTADVALNAAKQAGLAQTCIVSGRHPGCIPFEFLTSDDGSAYLQNVPINVREDLATIPYSSGTTGFPKGVMITHYNLVAMFVQLSHPDFSYTSNRDPDKQRVLVAFLPYYHAYGMVGMVLGAALAGDKQVVMPRFEPERFLQLIEKYKVNVLNLVPPVVVFITRSPLVKKYDLSSVETASCGAAPLDKDTEQEFKAMFNIPEVKQGYGMTETTVACALPLTDRPMKPGSCGVPLPNSEMQIVDPSTKAVLGPNQRGEIWVRGPNIMKGYLNRPDATRETLDGEGWLHTGDVGYYDTDSYFYIVDRIKELIKYKAFQVAPAELEALLLSHPSVADVAVIGVPDKEAGELPKAYVVRKPGMALSEHQVRTYVADHMSSFKHLRGGVEFIDVIPKSPSGKILRRQLRDRLNQSKL